MFKHLSLEKKKKKILLSDKSDNHVLYRRQPNLVNAAAWYGFVCKANGRARTCIFGRDFLSRPPTHYLQVTPPGGSETPLRPWRCAATKVKGSDFLNNTMFEFPNKKKNMPQQSYNPKVRWPVVAIPGSNCTHRNFSSANLQCKSPVQIYHWNLHWDFDQGCLVVLF